MAYNQDFEYIVVDCITRKVKVPSTAYCIATQGDYNVGEIHFMLLNRPSHIDPEDCVVTMSYWNAYGEHGDQQEGINVVYDNKTMLITLPIPPTLVVKSGKVRVGLTIATDLYSWNISPITLFVSHFGPDHPRQCPGPSDPVLDIIDNISLRLKKLEEADVEVPTGAITKDTLSGDLSDDLLWDEEMECLSADDIDAMWDA